MPTIADGFQLANHVFIPCIGLGTRQLQASQELEETLARAIEVGYRRFDTASAYGNERCLGKIINESGVDRSEFFISSKLWVTDRGYKDVFAALDRTLEALHSDYLDLYMIHWPETHGDPIAWQSINTGTWRAMEEIYKSGKVRSIGVCNFLTHHLIPLLARANIAPMVNQLEFHPGYWQKDTVEFCQSHGIHVSASEPLGRCDVLPDPAIQSIAKNRSASAAQVSLRWCLQHGVSALPRTLNTEDLDEYKNLFGFKLNLREMQTIDNLPLSCFSGLDPDHVSF